MRKPILAAMSAILVLALTTVALAADLFMGTWKLNVAKSSLPSNLKQKPWMAALR